MAKKIGVLLCFFFISAVFADNANWMSQIPDSRILNQIIIPGTHDSGTYGIQPQSRFSLGADGPLPLWIEAISNVLPISIVRPIVAAWAKTQPYTIMHQLNNGIRYLDFRVCFFQSHFYLCHALIGDRLQKALQQINRFAQQHPSEIIFLDINHIDNVDTGDQETRLLQLLQQYLGNVAVPNSYHTTDTMGSIRQSNRTVIIFMNTNQAVTDPAIENFSAHFLWNESTIDSPWPNATTVSSLKSTLDAEMALRDKIYSSADNFFVLQVIQTENANEIINGILNPSRYPHTLEQFELPVNQSLDNWMNNYIAQYGPQPVNIVIQDWFTKNSPLVPLAIQYDTESTTAADSSGEKLQQKLMWLRKQYSESLMPESLMPGAP